MHTQVKKSFALIELPVVRKRKSFAFTLIELLVVVVVIAILMGMLFPALSKAKEYGRSAKCKGNLKNLQIAAMSYFYEHHQLPYSTSSASQTKLPGDNNYYQDRWGWVDWTGYIDGQAAYTPGWTKWWGEDGRTSITNGALWPYTGKSYKVYLCPTFMAITPYNGTTAPDDTMLHPVNNPVLRSYAMNSHAHGIKMTELGDIDKRASRVMLFADISVTNRLDGVQISDRWFKQNNGDAYDGVLTGTPVTGEDYPTESVAVFHNGRGNAVFVDGHVETLLWSDTTNACSGNW